MNPTREPHPYLKNTITYAINDAIGWDDRKTLAGVYQDNGGRLSLNDETYYALMAVAKWGARQALERLEDE